MSDTEIRHRKHVQQRISQATGALGLTALGGTLAASRGGRTALRKIPALAKPRGALKKPLVAPPKPKATDRDKIAGATTPILATAAGLGGIGSFNFAAYTGAESKKKKPAMPVTHSKSLGVEAPRVGEVGKAADWKPSASKFDAEKSRLKRAQAYEDAGTVAAGGLAGAGAAKGGQAYWAVAPNWKKGQKKAKNLPNVKAAHAARRAAGARHGKVGAGLLVASGATAAGTAAVKNRNRSKSWASYGKRDSISAFGVDHQGTSGQHRETEN